MCYNRAPSICLFFVKSQDRPVLGQGIVMGIEFILSVLSDSAVLGRVRSFSCGDPPNGVFWFWGVRKLKNILLSKPIRDISPKKIGGVLYEW